MIKYHLQQTVMIAIQFVAVGGLFAAPLRSADDYESLGSDLFRAGRFAESVAAFDEEIRLDPRRAPWHWKRGISLYYAGRFAEGAKQFEGYQTVDDNDVENAVWRYLCQARNPLIGPERAREDMLAIKNDGRVPMMQIYDLFRGAATAEQVLAACRSGDPTAEQLNQRLFYADLYLGLHAEALGRIDEARRRLAEATRLRIAHYMGDVAAVHLAELSKSGATKKTPAK